MLWNFRHCFKTLFHQKDSQRPAALAAGADCRFPPFSHTTVPVTSPRSGMDKSVVSWDLQVLYNPNPPNDTPV